MYVHSVKLINFKSIGDDENSEIILEPLITAIIGKNESGKSNILNGLSYINFFDINSEGFSDDFVNRNGLWKKEIKYIVILKPSNKDIKSGIIKDTLVEISESKHITTGGMLEYYLQTVYSRLEDLVLLLDSIGTNPFQFNEQNLKKYQDYKKNMLMREYLDIPSINSALAFLQIHVMLFSSEKRDELIQAVEVAKDKWGKMLDIFPIFFCRKSDKHLKEIYELNDIEKELNGHGDISSSLLYDFVKLLDLSFEDFLIAVRPGITPIQETLRRKIKQLVDKTINKQFCDFYQTEKVSLDVSFNSGTITFLVQSANGEAFVLSERSNGLRWYLETFIAAKANSILGKNVVYLLDEPGISLHVNAQRELLKLFKHLTEQGNQVVYTTHSPYMLDLEEEGIHRIRAVVKDSEGFSKIYKSAYDVRIAPDSQQDTLAPIISAMGMNLYDTFGPAGNKINIVTEGISDYIYISTMAKILKVDKQKYAIIPSTGVTNCIHICSILNGWGCKCIALFDFDKEGVEKGGEFLRKEMQFDMNRHYCYVKDVSPENIDSKIYKDDSFMIEDLVLRTEIERFCEIEHISDSLGKPLLAKKMCTAIEKGSFVPSDECINNFQQLFDRIFSYVEE